MQTPRQLMVIAIQDLIYSRHNIFDSIVHLAMGGELSHLLGAVDVGERYAFKMNHFRGLEDSNVNALVEICDTIEEKIILLMEQNDIDYNELEFEQYPENEDHM